MNSLFRDGESTNGKVFTLGYLIVTGLAIYGFLNHKNFTPTTLPESTAPWLALPLSALAVFAVAIDRHPKNRLNSMGVVRKCLFLCICFAMSYAAVWSAVVLGAASLYTQALGRLTTEQAVVVSRYPEKRGRGCHYVVELRVTSSQRKLAPCVSEEIWRQVHPGENISAEFSESSLGIQLETLTRHANAVAN